MMFDCTPGDFEEPKPDVPMNIRGYTFWVPELENKINHAFLEYYRAKNNKEANLFFDARLGNCPIGYGISPTT